MACSSVHPTMACGFFFLSSFFQYWPIMLFVRLSTSMYLARLFLFLYSFYIFDHLSQMKRGMEDGVFDCGRVGRVAVFTREL